jgi:hypothetical protein
MKSITLISLFIFSVFFNSYCFAQLNKPISGSLSGTLLDEHNRPIGGANVLLFSQADSTNLLRALASDTSGYFSFASVKLDQYSVLIKMLGYRDYRIKNISITSKDINYSIGRIQMRPSSRELGEIAINGEAPLTTQKLGIITLNMSSSYLKTATNTLDVLSRSPGIRVDPLGNITLANGISPVVYIDGKQIPLTSDEIRAIAKEDLESISIIPNASARYDGETKAVIELKSKRDKNLGVKGNFYVNRYINRKFSGGDIGVSSTYKTKKWINYGRISIGKSNNFLLSNTSRNSPNSLGQLEKFTINGYAQTHSTPVSFQASSDYSLSKRQSVGILIKGITVSGDDKTETSTGILSNNNNYLLPTTSTSNRNNYSIAGDLNYKITSKSAKSSLQAYLDVIHYDYRQNQVFLSDFASSVPNTIDFPAILISKFPSQTNITSFRADYNKSLLKGAKFSAGIKSVSTYTDNTATYDSARSDEPNKLYYDYSKSNQFTYKENINSAYIGIIAERAKNSIDLAVRFENTSSEGNSLTLNQSVSRKYLKILPSFSFQHNLSKTSNISVNASRKLSRPTFFDLNPFRFYSNPYTYNEGNPFLLPCTITSADLNYQYKDFSLVFKYNLFQDQFAQMPLRDASTNTLAYIRTNLDKIQNFSIESNFDFTLTHWWKTHHYVVLYHTQTNTFFDDNNVNNGAFSAYLYGQHSFELPKKISLNFNYNYSSPSASQIYRVKSSANVSLGIQKSFFKDLLNTQLNISDIFNLYREAFYGEYNNVYISTLQKRGVQQISLRLTYQFGKSTFTRQNRSSGSMEEENRANH